jgi:hypothetical protein
VGQRRCVVEIALLHAGAAQRHQHADLHAIGIEMLRAHQAISLPGGPCSGKESTRIPAAIMRG